MTRHTSPPIDRTAPTPLYLQVYERLRGQILSGELRQGVSLPPERELSQQLRIDRNTLRQALQQLQKERLISRTQGRGTFVQSISRRRTSADTPTVAILLWNLKQTWEDGSSDYMQDVYGQLCSYAVSQGMGIHTPSPADLGDHLPDALREAKVKGVIAFPTIHRGCLALLERLELPKLVLESRVRMPGLDNVIIDSFPGVWEGVNELIRLGHRRMMYVGGLVKDHAHSTPEREHFRMAGDSLERLRSFRVALEDACLEYRHDSFAEVTAAQESSNALIDSLIVEQRLPTAFLAFDDAFAKNLICALARHGLRAPQDISVLGFGGIEPEAKRGELATAIVDYDRMIELSVQRIHERIVLGGLASQILPVAARFQMGTSIGPPRS